MPRTDILLSAIEAVHAAGLDEAGWPVALGAVAEAVGVPSATLETYDLRDKRHSRWHGHGIDPALRAEYLSLYDGRGSEDWSRPRYPSPRPRFPSGHVLDPTGRGREPFYTPYLGALNLHPFAAGVVGDERRQTVVTIRQDETRGALRPSAVQRFELLFGHVRQALAVGERLGAAALHAAGLAAAVDAMRRAAAVLAADGRVLHANPALLRLAAARDGLSLAPTGLAFSAPSARRRFEQAMARAHALVRGEGGPAPEPFVMPRLIDGPACLVVLKPILEGEREAVGGEPAMLAIVHDPLADGAVSADAAGLKAVFGLTDAEAAMAAALVQGQSPSTWARNRAVSVNTAYTHLRRLKEKTGAGRLSDLIHRLNGAWRTA